MLDPGCTITRVREWYRATCASARWIELVTGTREGVSFGCRKKDPQTTGCDESWVISPGRRGDQR